MCLFAIQPMQVMGIERFCRSVVGINLRKLNWRRLSDLVLSLGTQVPTVRSPHFLKDTLCLLSRLLVIKQ